MSFPGVAIRTVSSAAAASALLVMPENSRDIAATANCRDRRRIQLLTREDEGKSISSQGPDIRMFTHSPGGARLPVNARNKPLTFQFIHRVRVDEHPPVALFLDLHELQKHCRIFRP